jgi:hypothetical protein
MIRTFLIAGVGALLIAAPAAIAYGGGPSKGKAAGHAARHEATAKADDARSRGGMKADEAAAKAGEAQAEGQQKADDARAQAGEHAAEAMEQPGPADLQETVGESRGESAAKGHGAAKSAEMKARRDESKAIKAEYREGVDGGAERVRGKKPWWKVWGE